MKNKVENFINVLEEYGEFYFTSGDYKQDYAQITGVLKHQGYYGGCQYRFYFDNDLKLIKVENRF